GSAGTVRRGTGARGELHPCARLWQDRHLVRQLFVGLTQNFVGTLRVGYNCPAPMPGVHGGGDPAKALARLTDFYCLRLAQARFAESKTPPPSPLRLWASRVSPMTSWRRC